MTHPPTVPQQAQQTALALPASPALEPTAKGLEIARKTVARMLPQGFSYVRDLPASAIVPTEKCHAIITALEPIRAPAKGDDANPNREHAAVVAACMLKLLGAWPERKISDQKAYRANLETLLWEYPAIVCFQAIDELTRTSKFLPSRAELAIALHEANETLARLRRLARAHLELGERRLALAGQGRPTNQSSDEAFKQLVGVIETLSPWQRQRLVERVRSAGQQITDSMAGMTTILATAARLSGITARTAAEKDYASGSREEGAHV